MNRNMFETFTKTDEQGLSMIFAGLSIQNVKENEYPVVIRETVASDARAEIESQDGLVVVDLSFEDKDDYEYLQWVAVCEDYYKKKEESEAMTGKMFLNLCLTPKGDYNIMLVGINGTYGLVQPEDIRAGVIRMVFTEKNVGTIGVSEEGEEELIEQAYEALF